MVVYTSFAALVETGGAGLATSNVVRRSIGSLVICRPKQNRRSFKAAPVRTSMCEDQ